LYPQSKRPFLRRVERWLVGLPMALVAYMLEKAVMRSISRGSRKTAPPDPGSP
jgi:hypothetical protein